MSCESPQFSTLTPVIINDHAQKTIDALRDTLGAQVCGVMNCPKTGKVIHAALQIGSSSLFVSDAFPEMGMPATGRQQFYLYVDNVDAAFDKAVKAGWKEKEKPEDMFWGDRVAAVEDCAGNTWKLAVHVRDVAPEEMAAAIQKMADCAS